MSKRPNVFDIDSLMVKKPAAAPAPIAAIADSEKLFPR